MSEYAVDMKTFGPYAVAKKYKHILPFQEVYTVMTMAVVIAL